MTVHQIRVEARTVDDLMRATVDVHGHREAYVDGQRRVTFAEWDRAAGGVATAFADAGVGKGDVVCLQLPSSIEYAVCYQAALRLGAITSGVNPRLGAAERQSILERTDPKVVVHDPGDVSGWAALDPPPASRLPRLGPRDPVAIVWTSGTTGHPKGAVFDHDNLAAVAAATWTLSEPFDRRLSPLPFAHVGYMTRPWDELANAITTVIVPSPWRADEALRVIERERVTVGQGVPTQWQLMLDHPDCERTDTSSLRVVSSGAAPVPATLVRRMRARFGCPVVVRYTSTEASVTTGTRPDDPDEVVTTTVGWPTEGVDVKVGEEGRPQGGPPGGVGEVLVRSAAVMRGYWRDPEATRAAFTDDGWLRTGDLGELGADGNLRLHGRRSEMYIRGGYNVYPAEVEDVLASHPRVHRVAVVGGSDPVLGSIGHAFVVGEADGAGNVDGEELRSWCRQRLADYKCPDRVHLVDDLPLTAMQKVDKRALGEML